MISDFALFLFTTLAGAAAGAYATRAVFPLKSGRKVPWAFALVCLVLLGVSGVALLLHLQHPERVLNAFNNLGAGIAQEGVTTILFGLLVLADCILCFIKKDSPRGLVIATGVVGVIMTCTMGLCYAAFIGEPAWAGVPTIPFFVLGDLSMGAGLYLAFNAGVFGEKGFNTCFVIFQVLGAVAIAAVCAQFAGAGFGVVGLLAGCAIGPVASAIMALTSRKSPTASKAYAACALAVCGIIIARYAFYAASLY